MTRSLFLFLMARLSAGPLVTRADERPAPPTADYLLNLVRLSYMLKDRRLTGRLHDSEFGKEEPFDLHMSQENICFRFTNPPQVVNLDLSAVPATLRDVKPSGAVEVPLSMYGERVRGFDLTYEDLSMRFLYWPHGKVLGEESGGFARQKSWRVRVTTPDGKGPYGTVDVWVDQGSGCMAKMEAWDKKGNKITFFLMRSLQKVYDSYAPKEIRVQTYKPGNNSPTGTTYITFDKPEKK